MSRETTVYYALQSLWTYLGWARLRDPVARTGAAALALTSDDVFALRDHAAI